MRSSICMLAAAAAVAAGCSSGSGSSGGGASYTCDDYCAKVEPLGCPADKDHAACLSECEGRVGGALQKCPSQTSAYLSCVTDSVAFHCSSSSGQAVITTAEIPDSCAGAESSFASCAACVASSNDPTCVSCEKSSCCSELKAAAADTQFIPYYKCYEACTDGTCQTGCNNQYPALYAKLSSLSQCASAHCPGC